MYITIVNKTLYTCIDTDQDTISTTFLDPATEDRQPGSLSLTHWDHELEAFIKHSVADNCQPCIHCQFAR